MPLGKFPDTSVDQARTEAKNLVGEMARGNDPQVARQAARHEQTVKGLWEYWIEHAKQRKRTWAEDERQYNVFLKTWSSRKLSAVKKCDIVALHSRVGRDHGIYAANRLLALVRAMFNKASEMGFIGPNPATGIKKFKETKRDRFLHGNELKKFFDALAQEPDPLFRNFFMVALLTGARRANVQAMRWQDIDFKAGIWRIPETKSGKPVVVPLVQRHSMILGLLIWKRLQLCDAF
jgi:integrase